MFFNTKTLAAREARAVLSSPLISIGAIRHLKSSLKAGRVDGDFCENCFYGTLGRGMGVSYNELCDSLPEIISTHRALLSRHTYVENLCFGIVKGEKPNSNKCSALLLKLCNEELERRRVTQKQVRECDRIAAEKFLEEMQSEAADTMLVSS